MTAAPSGPVPPGWTANPSAWRHRLPVAVAATAGAMIAGYLALYQVGAVRVGSAVRRRQPARPRQRALARAARPSIALVDPATAEARASLRHLARERRHGGFAWRTPWGRASSGARLP